MLTYGRFLLYPGEILRVDSRKPLSLHCVTGRVWLTAGAEGRDHQLAAGDALRCPAGRMLVEGDGVVQLAGEAGPAPQMQVLRPALAAAL